MKLKLFLIVMITTFLGASLTTEVQAQTKKRTTPQTVTTQTATTDGGRKVILKSNGTWQYDKEDSTVAETTKSSRPKGRANSTLSFETGLVFKSGDVKPVARTTFYLLDDNLAKILRDAGLQAPRSYSSDVTSDEALVDAYASSIKYSILPEFKDFFPAATTALKPHITQTVTTDFGGKATFEPVAAGTYYLMGVSETPKGYVVWNLKVELKAGKNSVTLDQNNAVTAI